MGSVAKFAAGGKETHKKDFGAIAMTYPNCYVASVSMGANQMQTLNAFLEAEKHNGPSIIIAYAPCINHGINMAKSQEYEKEAVLSGYWPLYRYNPSLEEDKKLTIDPPFASKDYKSFTSTQSRYFVLEKSHPEKAIIMQEKAAAYNKQKAEKRKK